MLYYYPENVTSTCAARSRTSGSPRPTSCSTTCTRRANGGRARRLGRTSPRRPIRRCSWRWSRPGAVLGGDAHRGDHRRHHAAAAVMIRDFGSDFLQRLLQRLCSERYLQGQQAQTLEEPVSDPLVVHPAARVPQQCRHWPSPARATVRGATSAAAARVRALLTWASVMSTRPAGVPGSDAAARPTGGRSFINTRSTLFREWPRSDAALMAAP